MSMSDQPKMASLVQRAKSIILTPDAEWAKIDSETTSIQKLYAEYVAILAAIPAVCGAVGGLVFGYGAMGFRIRPSIGGAISGAIANYVLALIAVFVLALVIENLAATFGGTKDRLQAFKVAAYSGTAGWLAGVFALVPAFGFLRILGLYGLYLLYLGLPKLMKAPQDKALAYTALVVVAAIVVMVVFGLIAAPFMHMGMGAGMGNGMMQQP
jgi:hypothetical protein